MPPLPFIQVRPLPEWSPVPCSPDFKKHYLRASAAGLKFWTCQISPSWGLSFLRCKRECSQVLGEEGSPAAPLVRDNPGWLPPNTNNRKGKSGPPPPPPCHPQALPRTSCALVMSPGPGSWGWLDLTALRQGLFLNSQGMVSSLPPLHPTSPHPSCFPHPS